MQLTTVSAQAKQTLEVAEKNHWWFRVWGVGEIEEPVYTGHWWLIPTDDSSVPSIARKRIDAIKSAGIPVKEILVAHEAPKELCAPQPQPAIKNIPATKETDKNMQQHINTALEVMGAILWGVLKATGVLILLGLSAIVDPAVIVVLEDGTQIEVVRWYE